MTAKVARPEPFSLRRWSQRKIDAARADAQAPASSLAAAPSPLSPGEPPDNLPSADLLAPAEMALPPIESLTFESDFAPFFKPQVDESIKRAALKQLFRDPRFNIMDGLDTYIDDYTRPDPIPATMLEGLMQRRVSSVLPEPEASSVVLTKRDPASPATDAIAPPAVKIESIPDGSVDLGPETARETADPPPGGDTSAPTGQP